jgi:hypothetical protein
MRTASRFNSCCWNVVLPTLVAGALASCSDDVTTEVTRDDATRVLMSITTEAAAAMSAAIDDARDRTLPALGDDAALESALDALANALDARAASALQRAVVSVEGELRRIVAAGGEEAESLAVEADALRLILTQANRAAAITGSDPDCAVFEIEAAGCS